MVLAGLSSGEIKHTRCSSETDATWGCYAPASRPKWNMPCWFCMGKKGTTECKVCSGHGAIGMNRCPNNVNTGTMDFAFASYLSLREYGVLPSGGGMLDQSSIFDKVCRLAPSFEGAWYEQAKYRDEIKKRLKHNAR